MADDRVLEFPIDKSGSPPDEILWNCKACGHKFTEEMDKAETDKSKVLPLNLGGMMVYVCPNCYTFQLPEEIFDEVFKKANSQIIT